LYEVLDRRSDSKKDAGRLTVPKWWQVHRPSAEDKPEPAQKIVPISSVTPAEKKPYLRPAPEDPGVRPPILRWQDGRVELSLNSVNSAVAIGCILLVALVSFQIGSLAGGGDADSAVVTAGGGSDDQVLPSQLAIRRTPTPSMISNDPPTTSPPPNGSKEYTEPLVPSVELRARHPSSHTATPSKPTFPEPVSLPPMCR
jgi:hypothetical protein